MRRTTRTAERKEVINGRRRNSSDDRRKGTVTRGDRREEGTGLGNQALQRLFEGESHGRISGEGTRGFESSGQAGERGRPLPPAVRGLFERRFRTGLGDVRVHTDEAADRAARGLNATAFAYGNHVVFRAGEYDPGSERGRLLLGHELAHTIQQSGNASRTSGVPSDGRPRMSRPEERSEREARRAALRTLVDADVGPLSSVTGPIFQRDDEKGFLEEVGDTLAPVGETALSVGADLGHGGQRIVESWGVTGLDRTSEIGEENERAFTMLVELVEFGADIDGPLYDLVRLTIEYELDEIIGDQLTPEQRATVESLAGTAARGAVEHVVGRVLGSKAIKAIAKRIATKAATTAIYKRVATQIGVSAGASSTGIGIPIGATIAMGVMQRASNASRRLRKEHPTLYRELRQRNLDMGYFLIEPILPSLRETVRERLVAVIEEEMRRSETNSGDEPLVYDPPAPESPPVTERAGSGSDAATGSGVVQPGETMTTDHVYTVRRGDTLSGIARRFGVPGGWRAIWRANRETVGPNPNLIYPGQQLVVPQ